MFVVAVLGGQNVCTDGYDYGLRVQSIVDDRVGVDAGDASAAVYGARHLDLEVDESIDDVRVDVDQLGTVEGGDCYGCGFS